MTTFLKPSIAAEAAERLVRSAVESATTSGVAIAAAVVDESGLLKAFVRMDGANASSITVAQEKARSSALTGVPTGAWHSVAKADPAFAFGASSLELVLVAGGIPLIVDGAVVGALGVSGGTPDQDQQVATAAVEAES